MIGSHLQTPLPARAPRARRRVPAKRAAAGACVLLTGVAAFILSRDDGRRGDPMAVGSIAIAPAPPARAVALMAEPRTPAAPEGAAPPVAAAASVQQVQMENGVMVIRGGAASGTAPVTLKVAELTASKTPLKANDPQLIEVTATGPLPRISRDGRRPSTVYAAPPSAAAGRPRIALMVGGMGLDRASTAEAGALLPPAVTFGFAPYGDHLDEQVGIVRAAGHEVILQMPMEDFGRDDHSFPHMLKTDEAGNADRLRWLMSRFTGYAGVGNYLGGRLLADEASLKPLLQDVAARGLYFLDDGTAPRSLAMPVSRDLDLPSVKADVVIDARADANSVVAALLRLERLARERGFALGTATGRPATNATIAHYLTDAVKRGIVIVPVSQAADAAAAKGSEQAAR